MKIIIKRILNYFGISIYHRSTIDKSDDPLYVLTKLLPIENVLTIVDGGASIGDMSLSFSNKFPKATIYSFEPYTKSYKILSQKTSNNDKIVPHLKLLYLIHHLLENYLLIQTKELILY